MNFPCGRAFAAVAFFGLVLLAPRMAMAVQPDEIMADANLEARARHLSAELRCMVCQNESIDDSNAELARDLRILVRERLQAGDSDEAIRAFLIQRYGDFILLRPPFKATTWLLWGAPFLVLVVGAAGVILAARRRRTRFEDARILTDSERAKLKTLLEEEGS
ncbi:cytochrome c-type biogenesis protein [Methylocapsa aurea]|uniref:cytochrome c-type biogenesis protein n=1 Tax=Methylocapsa aurea TaxID=663610 RepID=UPI00068C7FFD|nr:cytochrome c-type biogenesis protein [Methylocapsa aurea]